MLQDFQHYIYLSLEMQNSKQRFAIIVYFCAHNTKIFLGIYDLGLLGPLKFAMCKSQHYNTYYCGNAYFNEMYLLNLVFILNQAKYVYTFMFVYTVHLRCVLQNLNEPGYLIFLQAFLKTGCATLPKSTSDEYWTNYLGNRVPSTVSEPINRRRSL